MTIRRTALHDEHLKSRGRMVEVRDDSDKWSRLAIQGPIAQDCRMRM